MCPNCRAFLEPSDRVCPYCDVQLGARAVDVRNPADIAGGLIPHARFTTTMILLVNVALFAATVIADMNRGRNDSIMSVHGLTLFHFGAKWNQALAAGQWWRLITAGFLHGGLMHFVMNSWALMDLGAQVEELYGSARLLVFYFVATFLGFFASALWSNSLSVGASAGIFGLIGAMIAMGVRHNTELGSAIRGAYIRYAIYGLLLGLLPGLAIDNAAHIGGLAGGFATAYLAREPMRLPGPTPRRERIWNGIAGVCLVLTAYCFIRMFLWMAATGRQG